MGRRRPDPSLDIDLFDDPAGHGEAARHVDEVVIGRHGPRWWWTLVVAVLVVGVVVAVIAASGGGTSTTGPSTTVGLPSTTRSEPTTEAPRTTVAVGTTVAPPTVPGPTSPVDAASLFGGTGWVLTLWDSAAGPSALVTYDLATGALGRVRLPDATGLVRAVVPTPGGVVVDAGELYLVRGGAAEQIDGPADSVTGPRVAAAGNGRVWVRRAAPPSLALFDPVTGADVEKMEIAPGVELIGVTGDGRPVVRGDDLRSLVVAPDGTTTLLDPNITSRVEEGHWASLVCPAPGRCELDLGGQASVPVPAGVDTVAVAWSPTGERVAVADGSGLHLVDPVTGSDVVLADFVAVGEAYYRPAANYLRSAKGLAWSPDGAYLAYLTSTGVVVARADGTPIGSLAIAVDQPLAHIPLALG